MNKSERVFILKKVKYSEADLVLSCLSRQGARLNFLAKSALKSKKRFSGGILEPTHYVELLYRENFGEEPIHYLQEAKLIDGFESIRSDYSRIELSLYFLKLMNKVSLGGEVHNENNFNLLGNALKEVGTTENLEYLKTHFELKFLYYQGVLSQELLCSSLLKEPISNHKLVGNDKIQFRQLQKFIEIELEQLFY